MDDLLQPIDIGLILSYRCTGECAHCLYNCGRMWADWMPSQEIKAALEAALRTWGPTFQVHLTGGEAFLNFELLRQAASDAAGLDIPVYAETNAAWCARAEVAERRLAALKEAGLQAVLISCSPFHAEHIPLKNTLLGIEAAVNTFGISRTIVNLPEWLERIAAFDVEEPVPLEAYIERFGPARAGRLFWEEYGLISGGRCGYQLGRLTLRFEAGTFQGQACRYEMLYAHHSHFDLYGNYIPATCGGISLGDWHALEDVRRAYLRGSYPPLIDLLIHEGPHGLYHLAVKHYGYHPLPGGYAGKCHLCADVRAHLFRTGRFSELRPAGFYQSIAGKSA